MESFFRLVELIEQEAEKSSVDEEDYIYQEEEENDEDYFKEEREKSFEFLVQEIEAAFYSTSFTRSWSKP